MEILDQAEVDGDRSRVRRALGRIFGEAGGHDFLPYPRNGQRSGILSAGFMGELLAPFCHRGGRLVVDLLGQDGRVGRPEGRRPGKDVVNRGPDAVDVVAVMHFAFELLWAHVGQRANHALRSRQAGEPRDRFRHRVRDTEIDHLHVAGGVDQQVCRFDVAMHQTPRRRPRMIDGEAKSADDGRGLVDIEEPVRRVADEHPDIRPVDVLHFDRDARVVLVQGAHADDVFVDEVARILHLVAQVALGDRIAHQTGQKFQCHAALDLEILRQPHDPHAAAAELAEQLETRKDHFARIEISLRLLQQFDLLSFVRHGGIVGQSAGRSAEHYLMKRLRRSATPNRGFLGYARECRSAAFPLAARGHGR